MIVMKYLSDLDLCEDEIEQRNMEETHRYIKLTFYYWSKIVEAIKIVK